MLWICEHSNIISFFFSCTFLHEIQPKKKNVFAMNWTPLENTKSNHSPSNQVLERFECISLSCYNKTHTLHNVLSRCLHCIACSVAVGKIFSSRWLYQWKQMYVSEYDWLYLQLISVDLASCLHIGSWMYAAAYLFSTAINCS